ncbi:hypothetical protein TNCV_348451 [Trichonephila clavipes]|nr:hypothetical protein TNCV_348451 [Trichonephila clavipes]
MGLGARCLGAHCRFADALSSPNRGPLGSICSEIRFASCLFNNMTSETVEVTTVLRCGCRRFEIQRSSMDCAMRPCIHIQWYLQ